MLVRNRPRTRRNERIEVMLLDIVVMSGVGDAARIRLGRVVPERFAVLGARARLGRLPGEDDLRPDAELIVALSESLWRERFGVDPGVVGRSVALGGASYTIVGVVSGGERGVDAYKV